MTNAETESKFTEEMRAWLVTRPSAVQEVAKAFPPGCTVMAKAGVELLVPAPGLIGQLMAYRERLEGPDEGKVFLLVRGRMRGIGPPYDAECSPDDLVVDEEGVVTREMVKGWLAS